MTLASFASDDRILNRAQRENLFYNIPFIDAIGKTNPIIIMDEPREGMDTENSIERIKKLNPLFKIRYSATHKVSKNKMYRLTPYDSYKQGLVKKIEVLTVTEKNDEATLKLELSETQNSKGDPKAKIKAWHQVKSGKIEFKVTNYINDKKSLKESEIYKIECALKHFATLGIDVQYKAPVKDYQFFKEEANKTINKLIEEA